MKNLKARNIIYNAKGNLTRFSDFLSRAAFGAAITAGGLIQRDPETAEEVGREIVERVNNFKTVLLSLVAAGGVIYLIISIVKAAKGHKNQDDRQLDQGVSGIFVSILLIMIDTVLLIFTGGK
jgi:hypothetical protein